MAQGNAAGKSGREARSSSGRSAANPPGRLSVGATPIDRLYRGRAMLTLLRDLALGEWSFSELAGLLGVETADIAEFAEEHQPEIQEVRLSLANQLAAETAGLWIARKQNRIAEIQGDVEDIEDFLAQMRARGLLWSRSHRDAYKLRLDAFRQVAEELGAFPQRSQAPARQGNTVAYIIETDDAEALR